MANSESKKYLVFLEFVDEVEVFLKQYENDVQLNRENFAIVSFHPQIKSCLLRRRIISTDSFHFCTTESHQKLICILEKYTDQIRKECSIKDSLGVEKNYAENLIFYLRAILSYWLYQVDVVSNAIEYYKPDLIIAVGSEQPYVEKSPSLETNERHLTSIISQICSKKGFVFRSLPLQIYSKGLKRGVRKWLKGVFCRIFYDILNLVIKPEQNLIIVPAIDFQMGEVLKVLKSEMGDNYNFAVVSLPFKKAIHNVYEKLLGNKRMEFNYLPCYMNWRAKQDTDFVKQKDEFRKKFFNIIGEWHYRGVNLYPWLKQKYKFGLEPGVIDATYSFSKNLNGYLNRWKPIFVLSQFSRVFPGVLGELCKIKDIPSLMIPHGTFVPVTDEYSKKEWQENALGLINTPYRYVAIQTPLAEKFLASISAQNKPVITGPILFGRKIKPSDDVKQLKRRFVQEKDKVILHAGTPKDRKSSRLINFETIDEYVDGMVSLINAVDKLNGVYLVIRFRPIEGLSIEELKNILPESKSYSIASDGTFADYLSIADLLVSFSSTTIEDALQNDVPVLLYNKYNRYQHIRGIVLSPGVSKIKPSAVYNVNREQDLLFGLEWILANHLFKEINTENLFKEYKFSPDETVKLSDFINCILEYPKLQHVEATVP